MDEADTFRCDCGSEILVIDTFDFDTAQHCLSVFTQRVSFKPETLWERVQGAWRLLRGKPYYTDQIILDENQVRRVIESLESRVNGDRDA